MPTSGHGGLTKEKKPLSQVAHPLGIIFPLCRIRSWYQSVSSSVLLCIEFREVNRERQPASSSYKLFLLNVKNENMPFKKSEKHSATIQQQQQQCSFFLSMSSAWGW